MLTNGTRSIMTEYLTSLFLSEHCHSLFAYFVKQDVSKGLDPALWVRSHHDMSELLLPHPLNSNSYFKVN